MKKEKNLNKIKYVHLLTKSSQSTSILTDKLSFFFWPADF